ncbi:MAG TPA: DUF6352 family protein [Xanthobacteraceae bacterium]|nr:DUF6352 family protein [Xanthobacteraceae bacterium]
MKDFWLSCGHHLLDRDERGRLRMTDEFMKLYLARPELAPPTDACIVERTLHAALLSDPWRPVTQAEIDKIVDADARENWQHMIALRNHLAAHSTLEAAYIALVRRNIRVPSLFADQLVHVILRNALDECDDAFVLRAAELFYRPQRLTVYGGSLLAADQEHVDNNAVAVSPLAAMFAFPDQHDIEMLSDENAARYWERSDRFDLAIDLTAGRRGLFALGTVIVCWVKHLLDIDITIEPLSELRNVALTWYVGLDANGTKIGDKLWHGAELDDVARDSVVGLFRVTFRDTRMVLETVAGEAIYLILAMAPDKVLRMKPQNLVTGLPVRDLEIMT